MGKDCVGVGLTMRKIMFGRKLLQSCHSVGNYVQALQMVFDGEDVGGDGKY